MGSQRVGHDWATELKWSELKDSKVTFIWKKNKYRVTFIIVPLCLHYVLYLFLLPFVFSNIVHACSVAQSCPCICDSLDYIPPGFCVHGILQPRILEWVAISSSRRSSQPRAQTRISCVSYIAGSTLPWSHPGPCFGEVTMYNYWKTLNVSTLDLVSFAFPKLIWPHG